MSEKTDHFCKKKYELFCYCATFSSSAVLRDLPVMFSRFQQTLYDSILTITQRARERKKNHEI
jgi:hypothetical protein